MISSQEPCFKDINLCFHCYHLQVHNININLYNHMTLSFLLLKKTGRSHRIPNEFIYFFIFFIKIFL